MPSNVDYWMIDNEKVDEIIVGINKIVITAKVKNNNFILPIAIVLGAGVCAIGASMVFINKKKKSKKDDNDGFDVPKKRIMG